MDERGAYDYLWFDFFDTLQNIFFTQTRINKDRHRSSFKQGECDRNKFNAKRDKEQDAISIFQPYWLSPEAIRELSSFSSENEMEVPV